jgi:sugar lactone lactonase YvrE
MYPWAVAVDVDGTVYVADGCASADVCNGIRKITATGVVSTLVPNEPTDGIVLDATGNLIAATRNHGIVKISPLGSMNTIVPGLSGGLALDAAGNLYMADSYNNKILKITSNGLVLTLAGGGGSGLVDGVGPAAKFRNPMSVAVDSAGNVFVVDTQNNAIRKVTPSGNVTTIAGSGAFGYANGTGAVVSFSNPYGIAIDKDGNLFVADSYNNAIRVVLP